MSRDPTEGSEGREGGRGRKRGDEGGRGRKREGGGGGGVVGVGGEHSRAQVTCIPRSPEESDEGINKVEFGPCFCMGKCRIEHESKVMAQGNSRRLITCRSLTNFAQALPSILARFARLRSWRRAEK
jgi:hypothetical protein